MCSSVISLELWTSAEVHSPILLHGYLLSSKSENEVATATFVLDFDTASRHNLMAVEISCSDGATESPFHCN